MKCGGAAFVNMRAWLWQMISRLQYSSTEYSQHGIRLKTFLPEFRPGGEIYDMRGFKSTSGGCLSWCKSCQVKLQKLEHDIVSWGISLCHVIHFVFVLSQKPLVESKHYFALKQSSFHSSTKKALIALQSF